MSAVNTASEEFVIEKWKQVLPHIQGMKQNAHQYFAHLHEKNPGKSNKGIAPAFQCKENHQHFQRYVTCMDGGFWFGIRTAGCGILINREDRHAIFNEVKPTCIRTHDDCGAFQKVFSSLKGEVLNLTIRKWGEHEAEALNIQHIHTAIHEMEREAGFHPEITIYYDDTGNFRRIRALPQGMVISRAFLGTHAINDLLAGIEILLDKPGSFGKLFSRDYPLSIVPIATENRRLREITNEVKEIIRSYLTAEQQQKVKVNPVNAGRFMTPAFA